jgi:16S rRNA (adenine1518-N6/adenine1519-N6)-dimethyltransferase
VHLGDATALDWPELLAGDRRWKLVANLPYNVAVPVIVSVLAGAPMVTELLVMVQREVAERLVASPGGRTIGIPTIKVAWWADASIVGSVPPEVFVPRPRVTSALVAMRRRPPPSELVGPAEVFALAERAYGQRRKMLRSTLGGVVAAEHFAAAGVAPTARPEELGVGDWAALAEAIGSAGGGSC